MGPSTTLQNFATLFRCCEVNFVDELLEEDRLGDRALSHLIRAARVDDRDVGNADESENDAEVGPFDVIRLHGRARRVLTATGDDDRDLLAGGETFESFSAEGESFIQADDVID